MSRKIVNGTYLRNCQGSTVSLMGLVENTDSSGRFFTVHSTDGILIKVILNEPLSEPLSGWIEIIGQASGKDAMNCTRYILMPTDGSQEDFDKESHNKLVQFLHNANEPFKMC